MFHIFSMKLNMLPPRHSKVFHGAWCFGGVMYFTILGNFLRNSPFGFNCHEFSPNPEGRFQALLLPGGLGASFGTLWLVLAVSHPF